MHGRLLRYARNDDKELINAFPNYVLARKHGEAIYLLDIRLLRYARNDDKKLSNALPNYVLARKHDEANYFFVHGRLLRYARNDDTN